MTDFFSGQGFKDALFGEPYNKHLENARIEDETTIPGDLSSMGMRCRIVSVPVARFSMAILTAVVIAKTCPPDIGRSLAVDTLIVHSSVIFAKEVVSTVIAGVKVALEE